MTTKEKDDATMSDFDSTADAAGTFHKHITGVARRNEEVTFAWNVRVHGRLAAEAHRAKRSRKYTIPDTSHNGHN